MSVGVALLTMAGCRGGCAGPGARTATPAGALSLLPAETQIVVSFDFRKIRTTPVWQQLSQLAADDPADRKIIEELTARTGLDPFRHIHRVIAAFPDDARQAAGAFAVLFEGEALDEKRLLTYARDQARLRGGSIEPKPHGKRTLWVGQQAGGQPELAGFFLDCHRFVLGGGGWAEKVAEWARRRGQPGQRRGQHVPGPSGGTGGQRAGDLAGGHRAPGAELAVAHLGEVQGLQGDLRRGVAAEAGRPPR